jgi:hypothetical protein
MPYWYNEPGKDEKFATVVTSNYEELNSQVEFSEITSRKDDDFSYLFGWITKITDTKKYGNNDWKFEPQLLMLKFARKNYEKWDSKQKKKVPTEQHPIEKLTCQAVDTLDETKVYSGKMLLQNGNIINMLLTKSDAGNTPMSDEMYNMMLSSYFSFTEIESCEHLPVDEIKLPAKSGGGYGGYGAKSQSEYDKLTDRVKFAVEQLKLAIPDKAEHVNNLKDIYALMLESNADIAGMWDLITQIMH